MAVADKTYILKYRQRNAEEDARLDQQHVYLKALSNNGKLLHPEILEEGLPSAIADVGCGTGVFLNDVARDYYACADVGTPRLVGFDVNDFRFVKNREPGVELHTHDCTTPFPAEYLETFDVVCVRVIWATLNKDDIVLLMRQALSLLRPGGYLQWLESEFNNIKTTPVSAELQEAVGFMRDERQKRGLMSDIPVDMMQIFLDLKSDEGVNIESFQNFTSKKAASFKAMGEKAINGFHCSLLGALKVGIGGIIARLEDSGQTESSCEDLVRLKRCDNFVVEAIKKPAQWNLEAQVSLLLAQKAE